MSEINDGGPAFPVEVYDFDKDEFVNERGMTLRDYFAAHAPNCPESFKPRKGDLWNIATWRYMYADIMIKARSEYYD
jgi:hypothetical protein